MSRILVIGGYGGFGARLTRRLLASGHQVLAGGRSLEKARRFCLGLAGAEPVVVDRAADLCPVLAELKPEILIDAAGPYQGSDYSVPQACIAAGTHYLDLADARRFVVGIDRLDSAAKAAGVIAISGASTVPALSSAVALKLAQGLDRVCDVDMALSAATHSTASMSVVEGALSYLGRPLSPGNGGGHGWQGLRRQHYEIAGGRPVHRWVSLVDVPDLELLPPLLPGEPKVAFRAGDDVALHMLALWLASWPARWGWLGSVERAAKWLVALQRWTAFGKGDRSAMEVRLAGVRSGLRVERRWTLIAEQFVGPEIPTMAAALLADDIAAGKVAPGARSAAGLLPIERFEAAFGPLAITCETVEHEPERRLYELPKKRGGRETRPPLA